MRFTKEDIADMRRKAYYDEVYPYVDGVAKVKQMRKYGLIDIYANPITKVEYDFIGSYKDSIFYVLLNGKWGSIDTKGKIVIPLVYNTAWELKNSSLMINLELKFKN